MGRTISELGRTARIVWAIASKDAVDAVKSKVVQGIIVGVLFIVLTGRVLPALLGLSDTQGGVIYDEGRSRLIAGLREHPEVRAYKVRSRQEMLDDIGAAPRPELGVVLPADFDQAVAAGSPPVLEGYVAHWASAQDVAALRTAFESALSEVAEQTVRIDIAPERLYPQPGSGGFAAMAAGIVMLAVLMIGVALVPYLIADERQTKTMDALLVSPAATGHVVAGKAIAGALYCLVAAGTALALNHVLVVHWWLAVLAVACGTLFSVGLGLLVGSIFEVMQNMSIATSLLAALLALPPYLAELMPSLPPALRTVISWLPSTALARLIGLSFARTVPVGTICADLALLVTLAALLYAATAWRIRRVGR